MIERGNERAGGTCGGVEDLMMRGATMFAFCRVMLMLRGSMRVACTQTKRGGFPLHLKQHSTTASQRLRHARPNAKPHLPDMRKRQSPSIIHILLLVVTVVAAAIATASRHCCYHYHHHYHCHYHYHHHCYALPSITGAAQLAAHRPLNKIYSSRLSETSLYYNSYIVPIKHILIFNALSGGRSCAFHSMKSYNLVDTITTTTNNNKQQQQQQSNNTTTHLTSKKTTTTTSESSNNTTTTTYQQQQRTTRQQQQQQQQQQQH
jgi:hypothetical protein